MSEGPLRGTSVDETPNQETTGPVDQDLRRRITAMSDESLLAIVESKSVDYTTEALEIANAEIAGRGGIEILRKKVLQSHAESPDTSLQKAHSPEIPSQSNEIVARLKKFYGVLVFAAYVLFMLVIGGSLWLYWLCVFVMIAFWIRVMINARRLTPEEEYAENVREMAKHPPNGDQPLNEQQQYRQ